MRTSTKLPQSFYSCCQGPTREEIWCTHHLPRSAWIWRDFECRPCRSGWRLAQDRSGPSAASWYQTRLYCLSQRRIDLRAEYATVSSTYSPPGPPLRRPLYSLGFPQSLWRFYDEACRQFTCRSREPIRYHRRILQHPSPAHAGIQ